MQRLINEDEMSGLLEALLKKYGYDFRHYAKASLKRRLAFFLEKNQLMDYAALQNQLLDNEHLFNELLLDFSITVTEMFRDPEFYAAFRKHVVPILKTYPFIKIWHAGCATGEEVYSMAILLYEEGFLSKATLYATDFNSLALEKAKAGIYAANQIKQYIRNYTQAEGKSTFSEYYTVDYGVVKLHNFLKQRIVFAHHNLVVDQKFGEMNVILCRNVLIYFDAKLQNQVLSLFQDSLCHRGFLCLGNKETLDFSAVSDNFERFCSKERIYRYRS